MSFVVEFLCKDQENTSGKCQLLKNVTHQIEKQFTLYINTGTAVPHIGKLY